MKIKIIDLLNMKANVEMLPVVFEYDGHLWRLCNNECEYYQENVLESIYLFEDYIPNNYDLLEILNEQVEIIEEDKKIEKLNDKTKYYFSTNASGLSQRERKELDAIFDKTWKKIDEIIDEVNKLKENK